MESRHSAIYDLGERTLQEKGAKCFPSELQALPDSINEGLQPALQFEVSSVALQAASQC